MYDTNFQDNILMNLKFNHNRILVRDFQFYLTILKICVIKLKKAKLYNDLKLKSLIKKIYIRI